jgi:hypothetical protein
MLRANIITAFIFLLFTAQYTYALKGSDNYSGSSVLANGKWYKIALTSDGVYRIDYSKLKDIGLENPSNPKIYGNNYGQLSYYNDDPKPDDLKEIPLMFVNGSDSVFNDGDYLLFYAKGTHRWIYNPVKNEYKYLRHNYSDTAYYFITSGTTSAKKIVKQETVTASSDYSSTDYDALYIHEIENENIIKSGREWYEPISTLRSTIIDPGFTNIITTEKINYRIRVLARASVPTSFRLYEGQSMILSRMVSEVNMLNTTGTFARIDSATGSVFPLSSSPGYEIKYYNNGESDSKAWIDYVILHGRAESIFSGNTLQISDSRSVSSGATTEFSIKSTVNNPFVWDVTNPYNVKRIIYTQTSGRLVFNSKTDSLKTFIVFTADKALYPVIKSLPLLNQDLHSSGPCDMVIVCHPLFLKQAEKLAQIHLLNSGLISLIVTPEQIYNEFSGGIPDIAAIRNFLRMLYKKYSVNTHSTRYLLLFGDGSYENKTLPPHNPNFVPTYQTQNSNIIVSSFTSDDFYSLLDDGEGEVYGTEDLGVGRLPVSDTIQAGAIVRKIERYLDPSSMGKWRNVICIAADDEDGNTHMTDAEGLASIINSDYTTFNIDKIYLDAFRQQTSINGQSYPDATKAINDRINSGCLIFDYIGHGNELGLAHERVVKTADINAWKNISTLPLFITATCEFSRFDDIDLNLLTREMSGKSSAGEMVLNNPDGGGIALMTTTRIVYSSPNYILNKNLYMYAFNLDSEGNALRLGDILKLAKNNSGNGMNKRNFSLLGDPAVRLAHPWNGKVITDKLNNVPVNQNTDSIKALSLVTISGHIADNSGLPLNNFDGIVYPLVYDKKSTVRTLANDGGTTMEYETQNNILFSGKTKVKDGLFSFTFMVPRDIDYSYGNGKISYYAANETSNMTGYFNKLVVGGFNGNNTIDTTGPTIKLYVNDTLFRSGGITDKYPVLLAKIEDEGGINTTGSGIGHDITANFYNQNSQKVVLNNFFETEFDDFKKGKVEYKLGEMTGGKHTVTLKAWDNYNNSSEESVVFIVETADGFILKDLINYPNPFINETAITAEHNRPDKALDITIYIYSLNGKIMKIIKTSVTSAGYKIPPVYWNGLEEGGKKVGRGIYPYKIVIKTEDDEFASGTGRLIIL